MIGDILLFGTLLMNAGAVLNFKLRQHPGVLTEPAVFPDLHRPVERVHDALHDCTVRLLRTQSSLADCLGSVSVLMISRMFLTGKPGTFPEGSSSSGWRRPTSQLPDSHQPWFQLCSGISGQSHAPVGERHT
ncbi:small integral membrane protein 7 isoform X1 [Arvicola amphibius]|uniref:small integral membrane protein 7 isoform X1 n=1 Tax=Arvicola amphibius TaxID=1047088 RepID=UPI0018E3CE82|nr:small integral membrane protein 7 isoform X1 [Arvicola amphibius]